MAATARPSRLTWPALAVALGFALAACSPSTTQQPYAPSDGVRATLGTEVQAENLLVITSGEGSAGVLLGGLTNTSDSPAVATVSIGTESVDVDLAAGQTVLLGATDASTTDTLGVTNIAITAVDAPPGATTEVRLATPKSGSLTVSVPVLDGTLAPYASLVPTASVTASASPSPTASPTP